jgi:hypothetical protein
LPQLHFYSSQWSVPGLWLTASRAGTSDWHCHRIDQLCQPGGDIARSLSDTFAGIRPMDVPGFIIAQFVALAFALPLLRRSPPDAE